MTSITLILIAVSFTALVIIFLLFAINNAQMTIFVKNNYRGFYDDTYLGMGNVGYSKVIKFIYNDELCDDDVVLLLKRRAKRYIKFIKILCLVLVALVLLLIYQYL